MQLVIVMQSADSLFRDGVEVSNDHKTIRYITWTTTVFTPDKTPKVCGKGCGKGCGKVCGNKEKMFLLRNWYKLTPNSAQIAAFFLGI